MSKSNLSQFIKKADVILLAIILVLSALGFVVLRKETSSSSMIEVTVAGEVFASYPLSKDGSYEINTDYGYNNIEVSNGQVWITDSDCPNKDCMNFGKMSKEGQVILCLPHKLAVRIVGNGGENDAVSY